MTAYIASAALQIWKLKSAIIAMIDEPIVNFCHKQSRNGSRDKGCFLGISLAVSTTYQISISRRVLQNEYHPKIPSLPFPPHLPFRRQQVFAFLPVCCHFPVHLYKRKPSYLWHQGNVMANFVVFTMESLPLQMVFKHVNLKSHSTFNFNQS